MKNCSFESEFFEEFQKFTKLKILTLESCGNCIEPFWYFTNLSNLEVFEVCGVDFEQKSNVLDSRNLTKLKTLSLFGNRGTGV